MPNMASVQGSGFYCLAEDVLSSDRRIIYAALCIGSSVLGFAGSVYQLIQWRPLLKNQHFLRRPSPNPLIVLGLAWACLFACVAVIIRGAAIIITEPPRPQHQQDQQNNNQTLRHACDSQISTECNYLPLDGIKPQISWGLAIEALSQYFFGATFLWTLMYAIDVYLQLASKKIWPMAYHLACWLIPAVMTVGATLVLVMGSETIYDRCPFGQKLGVHYMFTFVLLIFTMIVDPIMYMICSNLVTKRMHESGLLDAHNQGIRSGLRWKFLTMIIIFVLCWLPNLVDMAIQVYAVSESMSAYQLSQFYPIWMLEAVLNPLQGLLNCFVYGRHMLLHRVSGSDHLITETMPIMYNARVYQSTST